jgi:hypothetical protein
MIRLLTAVLLIASFDVVAQETAILRGAAAVERDASYSTNFGAHNVYTASGDLRTIYSRNYIPRGDNPYVFVKSTYADDTLTFSSFEEIPGHACETKPDVMTVSPDGRWLAFKQIWSHQNPPEGFAPSGAAVTSKVVLRDLTKGVSDDCSSDILLSELEVPAVGRAVFKFNEASDRLLVSLPYTVYPQSAPVWGVTQGAIRQYELVGDEWLYRKRFTPVFFNGLPAFNAGTGRDVAMSEDGDIVAIYVPAHRRRESETIDDNVDVVTPFGGWIPEDYERNPQSPGIRIVDEGLGEAVFFPTELLYVNFYGVTSQSKSDFAMSQAGTKIVHILSATSPTQLMTIRKRGGSWGKIQQEINLSKCSNMTGSINYYGPLDYALSARGDRLAVLYKAARGGHSVCLLSWDDYNEAWIYVEDASARMNAYLSSTRQDLWSKMVADSSLEHLFLGNKEKRWVFSFTWSELETDRPSGLPIWLLYEAAQQD